MRLAIIVLTMTVGINAFATDTAKKTCTKLQAMQAEKEVDTLKDWDHVYRSYKNFSQCDDGAIGEGYSDAVSKLLANNWEHLNRLIALTKANKGFQQFVLKHIDESVPGDVLSKISNNARSDCPAGGEQLCRLIESTARGQMTGGWPTFAPPQLGWPILSGFWKGLEPRTLGIAGPRSGLERRRSVFTNGLLGGRFLDRSQNFIRIQT